MSALTCPSCGGTISDGADSCSNCGFTRTQDTAIESSQFVSQAEPATEDAAILPPFFAVSLVKLAVMSFFTLGLYEFYWFYRNWQRVRVRQRVDISPFWRAFFGIIFCYDCFKRIKDFGAQQGLVDGPPILVLTIGWILTTIFWRLPDPFWLVSLVSFVFLLPVQAYANQINEEKTPAHDPNSRLTAWNWVGIVIGSIVFLLAIIGLLAPSR
jgi:hypothetical protein